MSGKNYIIKYCALDQLALLMGNRINEWYNELGGWSDEYTKLVDMQSFQGTGAESAKAYLQEVHGLLLCFIQMTMQYYQARYVQYRGGYYDIDADEYTVVPQEALHNVQKKLKNESETLQGISDSISGSVNSVSDLIYLKNPSIFNLKDTMDGLKSELNEFDQKIEDYESSELQVVRGDVRGMIESLRKTIQDYLVSGTNAVSYEPGSIAGNTNVIDLYQRVLAGNEYIEQHKDEIELAAQRQQEAFAQIQQDYYEAQCQAREDAGRAKLIQGGAAILIGTIAIVGSAGAAGPAVVAWGACIFGTGTAFYGVSTAAEGAQDVYYGSIGDLETASFNPIRDTVFMGNQTLYDLWGNLNMTAAGICMPLGKALNGAAGMGNKALAWATAKTIAVEGFKDMSADAISGGITGFAKEKFGLNETATAILNLGLNLGISSGLDKGVDFVGQKTGLSKGPGFTDDMSFADAKRYNQYWDELEKGIHIDHPGLTKADIDAWNLADAKLNEHIAISKVDTDAVLDLRMKELETQRRFLNGDKTTDYAGEMNFADAKRYNQYWDELEKGVHIDHPGLTQADIDAWKLADIKLDEHIAISKVDTDAVVKLRANEATAYDSFITSKNSIDEISSSSLLDIDAIRPKLKTEPDTAFFWSGRTDGIGGAENAANIAKSRGGVTLESTIEKQKIVMPEWDFNNPSTMEAWDLASGAYAEQVSGEIRAVIGSELRPGNIWENIELPRLKNNPNVTKITTIDPKTGIEHVIFER